MLLANNTRPTPRPAAARTTMNYIRRGSGPPILFIHGIPTSGRLWHYVVEELESRSTCLVVDLPGLGESPPLARGRQDPDCFADELEKLRAELGLSAWNVVGHDAGATIAVHYAAAFPHRVKRLVLLAPPVFPEFRPPWFFRLLRLRLVGELLAPLAVLMIWNGGIQAIVQQRDAATDEILESFRRPFRGLRGAFRLTRLVRWGEPAEVLGKTAALLSRVHAPTLILHGRGDGAIPTSFAQRAGQAIPDARVLLVESGHFLPLNVPRTVTECLVRFLDL